MNGMLPITATKAERVLIQPLHGAVETYNDGRFAYYASANYKGSDTFTLDTGFGAGTPTRRIDVTMVEHPIADPGDDGASTAALMGGDALLLPGAPEALSGNGRFIVLTSADGRVNVHDRHTGMSRVVSLDAFGDPVGGRFADISRGGRYLAYGSDKGVCVFD